jgi:hypothetical protein
VGQSANSDSAGGKGCCMGIINVQMGVLTGILKLKDYCNRRCSKLLHTAMLTFLLLSHDPLQVSMLRKSFLISLTSLQVKQMLLHFWFRESG